MKHTDEKGRAAIAQSAIAKRMRRQSGESTPRTKKWRVAVRGYDRAASIEHDAANKAITGGFVSDKYAAKLLNSPRGLRTIGSLRKYHSKEAWERRSLITNPRLAPYSKFDAQGRLTNESELRAILAKIRK